MKRFQRNTRSSQRARSYKSATSKRVREGSLAALSPAYARGSLTRESRLLRNSILQSLHVPPAPFAVNVTDCPTQIVVPACGVTVSKEGSLMLNVVVEVQPIISVTNTE